MGLGRLVYRVEEEEEVSFVGDVFRGREKGSDNLASFFLVFLVFYRCFFWVEFSWNFGIIRVCVI